MAEQRPKGEEPHTRPHESMIAPRAGTSLDVSALRYRLIAPQHRALDSQLLAAAYGCWRGVWGQTLRELDGADRVHSDDFTRQHELGALFYNQNCIGLTGYRWLDLQLELHREDSYFKPWPADLLQRLAESTPWVCVGSNLTVLPEWRGLVDGHSVKEILMTMAVERFLASDADAMLGTMRNDRGMNGLVYRLGASALLQSVEHHGVAVDLVHWRRDALGPVLPSSATAALAGELWRESWSRRQHEERTG